MRDKGNSEEKDGNTVGTRITSTTTTSCSGGGGGVINNRLRNSSGGGGSTNVACISVAAATSSAFSSEHGGDDDDDRSDGSSPLQWSIKHGHNNTNASRTAMNNREQVAAGTSKMSSGNRSGSNSGGGGSAINSFHERLIGSIESAISGGVGGGGGGRRNIRRSSDNEGDRFLPGGGGGEAGLRRRGEGGGSNSIRSGSSSVGHSPKKTGRMTTSTTSMGSSGGHQSMLQQQQQQQRRLSAQYEEQQQPQQPQPQQQRAHESQSGFHRETEKKLPQENIKPATSNHSSISSLFSALSGAAGSSFGSSGFSITGGGGATGGAGGAAGGSNASGGAGGAKSSSSRTCFSSGGGFPTASGLGSFFSSSFVSASSSLSSAACAAATAASSSTPANSQKDSSEAGLRTRASSLSSYASSLRNHKDASSSPTANKTAGGNHLKLNSKVEKVLNSIPGLTLGQVQGSGVPPAPSPSSSSSPTTTQQLSASTWGQANTASAATAGYTTPAKQPTTPTTTAPVPSSIASMTTNNCTSMNNRSSTEANSSAGVPQVQIQTAPTADQQQQQQQQSQQQQCSAKPLVVEPTPQRKHSATFSAFKLNDSAPPKRPLKLKNHSVHTLELYDTLHFKSSTTPQSGHCSDQVCLGSIVSFPSTTKPAAVTVSCRPVEEVRSLAKDFFDQYYHSIKRFQSTSHVQRWEQVLGELEETGTYNLTETELVYGAKLAWRNSVRCIGRIQWAKLQVFDARSVTTTTGMFEAVCKHIKYATNKGNIRSAITIFPQRTDGRHDFRIWNPQLITYAGYRENGSILGDPLSVEFTEVCMKLGWKKGKRTKWDILPLVLSADGHDPEYFEIPSELILEIPIRHPSFEWFAEMDLRWYALPAVSGMMFDCGGLEFTACPFNGWYMGTEIGCRDLGDVHRYNMLEEVAIRMGLDTKNPTTLWKDRAVVELNLAVLHSYQKAGVTVVDHHTASESFMKHYENEMRVRGGCPADWVWIVPPMSGSSTPVFHQEMALYHLKPNYEYQEPAWKTHIWKKGASQRDGASAVAVNKSRKGTRRKFHFKEIARAVKFTSKLFGKALSKRVKATILYATETGKSEMYARRLEEIFGHAFNAQVCRMDEYDIINIEHETLMLVVTSTFGNGDPPENGESFAHSLYAIKMNQGLSLGADDLSMASSKSFIKMNSQTDSVAAAERRFDRNDSLKGSQISDIMSDDNLGPLRNITFAVFALGSSAYPNFCAFGRYVDNLFGELGGERLMKLTCGDELAGQDQAFRTWAAGIFQTAADSFCLDFDKNMVEISAALKADTLSPESVRFLSVQDADDEVQALSKLHNRTVAMYNMIEKINLHESDELSRVTIKVVLRKRLSSKAPLSYQSGDHVGIMADNKKELIDIILERLANKPSTDDEPVQVQLLQEKHTPMGVQKQWIPHERLPKCSLRQLLTRYLDVTTPPRPNLLVYLVRCTEDPEEQERLNSLAKDPDVYEHWKQYYWPNLVTVLEQFPNVRPDATVLCTMLPLLQPRFYSVSSSPLAYSDELHLTVAVVSYKTRGGEGPVHYGVCSNYLNDVSIGDMVPCFVRSAVSFHMPADTSRPMIMIGPGTGIAPFRGFWQERKLKVKEYSAARFGKMTLFFGCRTKEMILYRSELEALKKENILSDIFLALSREPSVKKTYVQDLLRREGDSVVRQIMQESGHIYVCGDCTMAEDVYQTLKSIVQEVGNFTDSEVESYMLSLRDDNRYHEDIFGITHRTAEVHEKVRQTAMTRIESNYSLNNANVGK